MRFPSLALLAFGLVAFTAVQAAAQTTPWEYQGTRGELAWGKLDPAYAACSKGHEQSPIDIRGARLNTALQPIDFHYVAGPVTLENDGHTILARVHPGSYIVVGGIRYDLIEFDFHHPGEEAIKGKLSDMSVHLVHRSADGKLVILAVRLVEDVNNPNAVLAALWPYLPRTAGTTDKADEMVNVGGLLPTDRGYWTYTGSLSTPPCTEGVRWFVFEQDLSLSRDQLRVFASLFRVNSRGLQDPHGRRIEANE
ncbi:MAG: carbonic anhydrase family protein [Terracidiphilus sp.]